MYENWDNETLVKAVHAHEAEAKELNERAQEMRGILRERLDVTEEPLTLGDFAVTVAPNRRINQAKALSLITRLLDEDEQDLVLIDAVDTKKFKTLYPDLYAQAQDEGANKITIKEAE